MLGYNPFATGNPFLGTKLLGFSIGRGSGALKGLTNPEKFGKYFRQKVVPLWYC